MAKTPTNEISTSTPPPNSKPRRSFRRRRSTGISFDEGWDPPSLVHLLGHTAPLPPKASINIERVMSPGSGYTVPERPLSLGSSFNLRKAGGRGGLETEDGPSEGESPSPRSFKTWFPFFGKRQQPPLAAEVPKHVEATKQVEGEDGLARRRHNDIGTPSDTQLDEGMDDDFPVFRALRNPAGAPPREGDRSSSAAAGDDNGRHSSDTQPLTEQHVATIPPKTTAAAAATTTAVVERAPPNTPPTSSRFVSWGSEGTLSRRSAQRQKQQQRWEHQQQLQEKEGGRRQSGRIGDNSSRDAARAPPPCIDAIISSSKYNNSERKSKRSAERKVRESRACSEDAGTAGESSCAREARRDEFSQGGVKRGKVRASVRGEAVVTSAAAVVLEPGAKLLCLDTAIGTRSGQALSSCWRSAEITEILDGVESEDDLQVRVTFSDDRDDGSAGAVIRLRDEWNRLALSSYLNPTDMSDGRPLIGDALAASWKHFSPCSRHMIRRHPPSTAHPKNVAAVAGASKAAGLSSPPSPSVVAQERREDVEGSVDRGRAAAIVPGGRNGKAVESVRASAAEERRRGSGNIRGRSGSTSSSNSPSRDGAGGGAVGRASGESKSAVAARASSESLKGSPEASEESVDASQASGKGNDHGGRSGGGSGRNGSRRTSSGRPPTSRPARKGHRASVSADSGGSSAVSLAAIAHATSTATTPAAAPGAPPDKEASAGVNKDRAKAVPPSTGVSKDKGKAVPSPAVGVGRNSGVGRFFASGVGGIAAASAGNPGATTWAGMSSPTSTTTTTTTTTDRAKRELLQRTQEAVRNAVEIEKVVGAGGVPGKPREAGNQQERRRRSASRSSGSTSRKKRAWTLWDLRKPPVIGDRFDGLDYFVSSQTQLESMRWRAAEVLDVRQGKTGTEVLVHYIRWGPKWNRWVSLTQEPERFAPYMSQAPAPVEPRKPPKVLAEMEGAHQEAPRSTSETNGSPGTATMTSSSASSTNTPNAGGVGSPAEDGSSGSREVRATSKTKSSRPESTRLEKSAAAAAVAAAVAPGGSSSSRRASAPLSRSRSPPPPASRGAAAPPSSQSGSKRSGSKRGQSMGSMPSTAVAAAPPAVGGWAGGSSPTASWDEATADAMFRDAMRRKGLSVVDVEPDGNCLFRSVSHQIYGDAERHYTVRRSCVEHMSKHKSRFGVFVAEDFVDYLYRIRQPGVWGDDLEIRALEELFDRPIEIYSSEGEDLLPMKIDFDASGLDMKMAPIKLSYHGQSHYNSVRDQSLRYPLQPRRSKRILRMREAQHANAPSSAAAVAAAAASSVSRAGGGKAGSRKTAVETRRGIGRRWGGGSSSLKGGGGGGGESGGGSGGGRGGAKNFAGVAFRTLFGGVSSRISM